jgi:hypothetical protein
MEYIQLNDNHMQITGQGLADFLRGVEEQFNAGYRFDFERNETYPQNFGSYYHVVLVKEEKPSVSTETPTRKTKVKE